MSVGSTAVLSSTLLVSASTKGTLELTH
jgi:hypothetical protein